MKPIRNTVLGAAALAFSMPLGFSLQSEAPADSAGAEACACTCAACVAKHGAKAKEASQPVPPPAPNLPDAPEDIDAEVARILAMDLKGVDSLLSGEEGKGLGITSAGVAEVVNVIEVPAEPAPAANSGERGYMGISLGPNEEGGGAMVGTVNPGSPAEKSGLKPGDLIVAAEGMPLDSNDDLIAAVIDLKVGETASLEIERGDEELELDIVLGPQATLPQLAVISEGPLTAIGYTGDVEEEEIEEEVEEEVLLPSGSPMLLQVDGSDEGFIFMADGEEAPGLKRRVVFLESAVDDVEKVAGKEAVQLRWSTDPGPKGNTSDAQASAQNDALPDGYVEVYTRRERRPATGDELRLRMAELEREVAELSKLVDKLRAELDRRNPR